MTKTLYCVKLNQRLDKYLSAANITNVPATMSQSIFDYAVFFENEDDAFDAIQAYLNSAQCKMSKQNSKFISVESYEFEYTFKKFPMTNNFKLLDTNELKTKSHDIFHLVYLNYGDFNAACFICTDAYKSL